MTKEDFDKAIEALESGGDFIVAVSTDDKDTFAVHGDPFKTIPMAIKIIAEVAGRSNDKQTHLLAAITFLQMVASDESGEWR